MDQDELVRIITEMVEKELAAKSCPGSPARAEDEHIPITVGVSNRHLHISEGDLKILFGPEAQLTKFKDLSQPGQYASNEKVTLVGPKGVMEQVRILGPVRKTTQVEISVSDCFKLGIRAPIRDSGQLTGSAGLTVVGPVGSVTIPEGAIIAARHIHMHPKDAAFFGVKDGDRVDVKVTGPRGVTFSEVLIRVNDQYNLEMHLDMDEANAASIRNGQEVEIVK